MSRRFTPPTECRLRILVAIAASWRVRHRAPNNAEIVRLTGLCEDTVRKHIRRLQSQGRVLLPHRELSEKTWKELAA